MASNNELPAGLLDWVARTTGGEILRCARHTARREAWCIDVRAADGGSIPYFLRIDRALAAGQGSTRNLRRETALIRALQAHLPTQGIVGWNDEHCAALQTSVAGRAELNRETRALQHAVMLEFMEILARMHRIDIDALALPEFVRPTSAAAHSLLEIAAVENSGRAPVSACAVNPLAAFGKRWLINHAPQRVQATVLLQGDTGPANFMFDDDGVTAVVDWEWGHYGDPMEDLGNIWLRDFFYPSSAGDLSPYFDRYAKASGFALDHASIRYYRVHQLVRSVIGLVDITERKPDWRMPLPLNLGYRALIDVETCRAIAEASGWPPLAEPPLDSIAESDESLYQTLAQQMEQWVAPQIADAAASDIARGHAAVMRYLDRRERCGAEFAEQELSSLRSLLGDRCRDLDSGRAALIAEIETLPSSGERAILEHLSRVVSSQAVLMAPLTAAWRDCRWATIGSQA